MSTSRETSLANWHALGVAKLESRSVLVSAGALTAYRLKGNRHISSCPKTCPPIPITTAIHSARRPTLPHPARRPVDRWITHDRDAVGKDGAVTEPCSC
jgi:hypothetical protein